LPAVEEKRIQFRSAFFDIAPSMFLAALDQTIIVAALPAIAGSLGGFSYLAWVVTAYLLAASIIHVASLSVDLHRRKVTGAQDNIALRSGVTRGFRTIGGFKRLTDPPKRGQRWSK
jgi:MFS family permease